MPALAFHLNMVFQGSEKAYILNLSFRCKIAPDPPACIRLTRSRSLLQRRELQKAMILHRRTKPIRIQIHRRGRHGFIDRINPVAIFHSDRAGFILICDHLPAAVNHRIRLIIQRDCGVRQVVKQSFQAFMEERQPVFDACVFHARTDMFIKRIIGASCAEFDPVILAEPGDGGVIEDDLRHRCKLNLIKLLRGALRCRVKMAGTVQNVAKEVKPHRLRALATRGREDINDTTAQGVIAGLHHR